MQNKRENFLNTKRDAWVEINLGNIENNILEFKKITGDKKILAVVKADSYGCGSVMISPILLASGVDMLGVASIDEGMQLREAKFDCPILVLGAVPVWSFDYAAQHKIEISIFSEEHIEACKIAYQKTKIKPMVHVKIDTGMNRIGIPHFNAVEFIKKVQSLDFINLKGVFTHFACAENEKETELQIKRWNGVVNNIDTKGLLLHIQNTAGVISKFDIKSNMVRIGIGLYGYNPDLQPKIENKLKLKPVVNLKGRITNIHIMPEGDGVSYGHTFVTDKDIKVATVPIGYADGVSRKLSNKIYGYLNGNKVKQIGNITMDQMMFDITGVDAKNGDIIEILNDKITLDDWAEILGTINYELMCRLKVRLARVYTR